MHADRNTQTSKTLNDKIFDSRYIKPAFYNIPIFEDVTVKLS